LEEFNEKGIKSDINSRGIVDGKLRRVYSIRILKDNFCLKKS